MEVTQIRCQNQLPQSIDNTSPCNHAQSSNITQKGPQSIHHSLKPWPEFKYNTERTQTKRIVSIITEQELHYRVKKHTPLENLRPKEHK